jgi:hypothetical protein
MKRYKGRILMILTFAIGIFVMGTVQDADAGFILELDDLTIAGTEISLPDGDNDGVITYTGPLPGGSVFTVNVTTGISKPVIGGPSVARMDLNSVNVSGTGAGNLEIRLTDTDFSLTSQPDVHIMTSRIGGTTDGTVTLDQWLGPGNGEWEQGISPGTHVGGPGAFSSTLSTSVNLGAGDFSLTEIVNISHTAAGQISSFDAESNVAIPEPTTMCLMGFGILGLVGVVIRQRRKVK